MDVKHNTYNIQEVGLAKALVRRGHTCDIVFWTDKEERDERILFDQGKAITVFYRHSRVILKNAIYENLDSLIAQYDVIQPSEYNQLQSWQLARKYPTKTVIFHGPYYSSFNKRYNAMCRVIDLLVLPAYKKLATSFLVKSDLAKDFLIEKGISESSITVAGVGIDIDALSVEKGDVPAELLNISQFKDRLRLLYVGRLEPRRNIPFLFDVLKSLLDHNVTAELIMIGTGDEEYCRNSFNYAEKLGVRENIYWVKKAEQRHLAFAYQNTEVFLLPTRYEIFGMVLLEAMYFGKPVITTRNGGSEMLIENGKDGIILDGFDANEWSKEIIKSQTNNQMGESARNKIISEFTWDKLCPIFIRAYENKMG